MAFLLSGNSLLTGRSGKPALSEGTLYFGINGPKDIRRDAASQLIFL